MQICCSSDSDSTCLWVGSDRREESRPQPYVLKWWNDPNEFASLETSLASCNSSVVPKKGCREAFFECPMDQGQQRAKRMLTLTMGRICQLGSAKVQMKRW